MISFDCQCGKPFRFSLKFKGRPFRCNTCGRPLVVPEESEVGASTGKRQVVPVGSGEIITPIKPVLKIDLGAIPHSLQKQQKSEPKPVPALEPLEDHDDTPIQGVLVHSDADDTVGEQEDEDEEIVISGQVQKIKEDEFHVDLDIGGPMDQDKDSISTILSKAAISNVLKDQAETPATAEEISAAPAKEKNPKRGGMLSGFFKRKPVVPNVIDLPPENPASEPVPVKSRSKKRLPAPAPEKATASDHDPKKTAKEKSTKVKPVTDRASPSKMKKIVTTGLIFLGPILIVALSVLLFRERGQTATERENVVKLKKDVENLNRRIADLQKTVEPKPVDDPPPFEEPKPVEEPQPVEEPKLLEEPPSVVKEQ